MPLEGRVLGSIGFDVDNVLILATIESEFLLLCRLRRGPLGA